MQITFDPAKDTANIAKHGVSLTFAAQIISVRKANDRETSQYFRTRI